MAYEGWARWGGARGPGVRRRDKVTRGGVGLEFHLSQAPDNVAELGLGADPAEEARQGSPRRRATRA